MNFPSSENEIELTRFAPPSRVFVMIFLSKFQIIILRSLPALAMYVPSGLIAKALTSPTCAFKISVLLPFLRS